MGIEKREEDKSNRSYGFWKNPFKADCEKVHTKAVRLFPYNFIKLLFDSFKSPLKSTISLSLVGGGRDVHCPEAILRLCSRCSALPWGESFSRAGARAKAETMARAGTAAASVTVVGAGEARRKRRKGRVERFIGL